MGGEVSVLGSLVCFIHVHTVFFTIMNTQKRAPSNFAFRLARDS